MNCPSLSALILSLVLTSSTQATGLVIEEIMEPTISPVSKPLRARVEEVARSDRTSTVKVNVYSGTSVARAMIVVRGLWLIGEARGDEYFWTLGESVSPDGTRTFVVGYAKEDVADPAAYFNVASLPGSDKAHPLGKPMRVSEYGMIFKPR